MTKQNEYARTHAGDYAEFKEAVMAVCRLSKNCDYYICILNKSLLPFPF